MTRASQAAALAATLLLCSNVAAQPVADEPASAAAAPAKSGSPQAEPKSEDASNAAAAAPADGKPVVDASKPTNFYTVVAANLEANRRDQGGNVFGLRGELMYAPHERHLFMGELPLLYNDQSEKVGLGDVRTRYFFLPYKNYDKFFGAFGPSVDVFWPTGSFADKLGSSSYVISPGLTAGLMFADWIQAFPVISYQLTTKPMSDAIPEAQKKVNHGLTMQAIVPVIVHPKVFVLVTPIVVLSDLSQLSTTRYMQELLVQYQMTNAFALSGFWRGVFADNDHTFRLGVSVYLL